MMAGTELRGERIRLRDFLPDDIDDVFAYASDPIVTRYAGWTPHRTPFDSMAYIRRCLSDDWGPVTFAVEYLCERRVIGVVDISIVSGLWGLGEIGYTLARAYWGRGFNVEAGNLLLSFGFREMGLRRIQAVCDLDNQRSYRTMEKIGMARERLIPQVKLASGRVVDRVMYSILRKEWEQIRRERVGA
jgi:[ribosomal protein S5]-alanine N-acetyltransferase